MRAAHGPQNLVPVGSKQLLSIVARVTILMVAGLSHGHSHPVYCVPCLHAVDLFCERNLGGHV